MQNSYGLGFNKLRTFITRGNVTWKSMHIALRDLGLDESVKVDGNLIYTALHIPKDILSLEAKKTTYNNFKESMTSWIQNDIQSMINDIVETLYSFRMDRNDKLVASYSHLPVMQFVKKERYEATQRRAEALSSLRAAGLPDNLALKECDFDETIKLNPYERSVQQVIL